MSTANQPTVSIEVDRLAEIRKILETALEPPTPYKRDPLEFSNAAHEEKDKLIKEALLKLPLTLYSEEAHKNELLSGELAKRHKMFEPGTQIAYIPTHADGDINHPDVEFGFVVSSRENDSFCRYWRKGEPGKLRTMANSELTPNTLLVEHRSVDQVNVDAWISLIQSQE